MRTWIPIFAMLSIAACGGPTAGDGSVSLPARDLLMTAVSGDLPGDDPLAAAWEGARAVHVEMHKQDVAEPRLTESGVTRLSVRGLHDRTHAAFLLSWDDPEPDELKDVDFTYDACAIQFPATGDKGALPDAMMGEAGKAVEIALWRYGWQRRLEGAPFGVEALYPNASVDHYPPEGARDPGTRARLETLYDPPRNAGNALAEKEIRSAVEDLRAEGFGSLAHMDEQKSMGKGVHKDGRWHVVITRPLDLAPGSGTAVRPGLRSVVAFAIWDGAKNQSGARKMRSIWVPLKWEETTP